MTQTHCDPSGLEFFDSTSARFMKYVYPVTPHSTAGWILYKNSPDGGWVPLRKATNEDIQAINKCVVAAHHHSEETHEER